jgi:hypothetical protein
MVVFIFLSFLPLTKVSALRQAKAETSSSMACRARENSMIDPSQSPRLCRHWFRCRTTPLQNTNCSESGWILKRMEKDNCYE